MSLERWIFLGFTIEKTDTPTRPGNISKTLSHWDTRDPLETWVACTCLAKVSRAALKSQRISFAKVPKKETTQACSFTHNRSGREEEFRRTPSQQQIGFVVPRTPASHRRLSGAMRTRFPSNEHGGLWSPPFAIAPAGRPSSACPGSQLTSILIM